MKKALNYPNLHWIWMMMGWTNHFWNGPKDEWPSFAPTSLESRMRFTLSRQWKTIFMSGSMASISRVVQLPRPGTATQTHIRDHCTCTRHHIAHNHHIHVQTSILPHENNTNTHQGPLYMYQAPHSTQSSHTCPNINLTPWKQHKHTSGTIVHVPGTT